MASSLRALVTGQLPTPPRSPARDLPAQAPLAPGTIDLYNRPKVANPEGGISTVYSMSFQDEDPSSPHYGREVLVPLADEGRILSADQARAKYYRTPIADRQHLGIFTSPDAATAYAQQLHEDYARGRYDRPKVGSPPPRPRAKK